MSEPPINATTMAIDSQLFLDFQIPEVLLWRRLLDLPERPRDDDRLRED
jgi:hypothetical protein